MESGKKIVLSDIPYLKEFYISFDKFLNNMDLSEFKKLSVPELKGCGIKDLRNLKIPNTLKKFDISLNKSLKYIDLHDFNNLEELTLIGCNIRRIELSKNVKDKIVVNMAKINYS